MCGRVIQSSAPIRYAIVNGMNVRESRVHNYPPRWNGAPSQDLLVIRRNHKTGEVSLDPLRWGLIPYWCEDPKGGRNRSTRNARLSELSHRSGRLIVSGGAFCRLTAFSSGRRSRARKRSSPLPLCQSQKMHDVPPSWSAPPKLSLQRMRQSSP
jgi:hypothetical protein